MTEKDGSFRLNWHTAMNAMYKRKSSLKFYLLQIVQYTVHHLNGPNELIEMQDNSIYDYFDGTTYVHAPMHFANHICCLALPWESFEW